MVWNTSVITPANVTTRLGHCKLQPQLCKAKSYLGPSCCKSYWDGWKKDCGKGTREDGSMLEAGKECSCCCRAHWQGCWTLGGRWGNGFSSWYCPWIDRCPLQGSKEKTLSSVSFTVALIQCCLSGGSVSDTEGSQLQNASLLLPQVSAPASCYIQTVLASWILFPASEWLGRRCVSQGL